MRHRAYAWIPLLAARALFAQADTAASQTPAQRADTARLAPTVVTVLRTSIEQSRAPFAVGVATRDQIQRGKPGLALDEALSAIPGVQVDNRFNYALGERISIRGFGARAQFGVRGVRVLLDGIPMTLADGQTSLNNVDVATLARAEVLRGPASALYGNASGGVIQLQTDAPGQAGRDPGGDARVSTGADGLRRVQLGVRAPIGSADMIATAARMSYAGYRDWNDARNDHANVRLDWALPSDGVSLVANWVDYSAHNPGGISQALLATNRDSAPNKDRWRAGETGRQGQVGVTWQHRFAGLTSDVAVHAIRRHIDNPIPQSIVVIDRAAGGARAALSAEPRVAGRAVRLSAGAERQLQDDDRRNFVNVSGTRGATTLDQGERVTNDALFAQGTLPVLPRVLLMLGGRYDRVRFRADDHLVGAGNPDDSGDRAMTAVSPSAGMTYTASRSLDVYANYAESFETPTTSELANQESGAGGLNPSLEPQRTSSVELGVNGSLPVALVAGSYQLAVYDASVRDALIPFEVPSAPGRQYFRNAGSTRHRGLEAATAVVLPASLFLRAAYTYTDARFTHYTVTSGSTTTVYDGRRVPGVAHNRADATLSFQRARVFVDYDVRASSSIPVNDANSERSAAYVVHGLRLGVRDLAIGGARFTPHAGVLNLFDARYNTSVVVNAFGGRFYEPGPPRSLYAGLDATF